MKRRIICRIVSGTDSQTKLICFHDTRRFVFFLFFFFFLVAVGCNFFSLSHSPRNALLIIIYTRFRPSTGECLSTVFLFGTDVLWRVYDPCRETLNGIKEGCVCVDVSGCVLAPIGVWWMPRRLLREKRRGSAPVRIDSLHLLPIIRAHGIAPHSIQTFHSIITAATVARDLNAQVRHPRTQPGSGSEGLRRRKTMERKEEEKKKNKPPKQVCHTSSNIIMIFLSLFFWMRDR
jgi:hypothetical protein